MLLERTQPYTLYENHWSSSRELNHILYIRIIKAFWGTPPRCPIDGLRLLWWHNKWPSDPVIRTFAFQRVAGWCNGIGCWVTPEEQPSGQCPCKLSVTRNRGFNLSHSSCACDTVGRSHRLISWATVGGRDDQRLRTDQIVTVINWR